MKTTIKVSSSRAVSVSPSGDGVLIELKVHGVAVVSDVLTADQAGALLFGMEQAMEAGRVAKERAACPKAGCGFPGRDCSAWGNAECQGAAL